jgi:4-amino-4-deoxy-L-arabinose transferase-like glycosyltransferase
MAPTDAAPDRTRRGTLVAVTVIAFGARLLWALAMHVDVRGQFLLDMSVYDLLARRLAAGEGYVGYMREPVAFFPPGYPAILAGLYTVFGQSLAVAWVANAVFGALTCLLVYAVGARLFDRRVGLVAAAVLAVFPGDVFSSAFTLSEATFGFLFTGILYLAVRWNDGAPASRWLALGVATGVASLVRGVALPFLVVPAVVWIAGEGIREAFRRAVLAGVGVALVVLPWTIRNYAVMGAPIVLSTDGSYAFFNGHNPLASGTQSVDMNELRRREWGSLARLPSPQREVEQAKGELRYAVRYALTHPWHELTLIPRRVFYLYEHDHHALLPATPPRRLSVGGRAVGPDLDVLAATLADVWFFGVLLLALAGLRRVRDAAPAAWLLPLTIAYFTLLHGVLFFGDPRYHAPFVPVLAILAAAAVRPRGAAGSQRLREPNRRPTSSDTDRGEGRGVGTGALCAGAGVTATSVVRRFAPGSQPSRPSALRTQ